MSADVQSIEQVAVVAQVRSQHLGDRARNRLSDSGSRARYFREQVEASANGDPNGPVPIWIWPQGEFSEKSWLEVEFAPGESTEDYLKVLRDFSQAFAAGE